MVSGGVLSLIPGREQTAATLARATFASGSYILAVMLLSSGGMGAGLASFRGIGRKELRSIADAVAGGVVSRATGGVGWTPRATFDI